MEGINCVLVQEIIYQFGSIIGCMMGLGSLKIIIEYASTTHVQHHTIYKGLYINFSSKERQTDSFVYVSCEISC